MPPLLAKALAILSEQDGNEVVHLRERFPDRDNIGDQEWLQDLLDTDERWVIISTDYRMRHYDEAKEALRCKFTFFILQERGATPPLGPKQFNVYACGRICLS